MGYKMTPIGEIPEDWTIEKIASLFTIETGTTPSTKEKKYWEEGTIHWITPTDLSKLNNMYAGDSARKITPVALRDNNLTLLPRGSLILSTRAPVGYVAIIEQQATFNQGCKGLIPKDSNTTYPEFYYYYLLYQRTMLRNLSGGSTFKELSKAMLEAFQVACPPLPEQKQIAEILSTVDTTIQKVNEAIAKTERLKRGLMQELLTRGIGHKEFVFSKELGHEIPREWEVVKLESTVAILDSKRIPLSAMERSKRKGPYPYCGANGIIDYIDGYLFDGEFILLAEDGGDFGKHGRSAYIMSGRFWVNNHAHVLKALADKATNSFLLYALNFFDLSPYIVGSTRKKLNQDKLRSIKIPLPPLPEQRRIAEILSTVDEKLELERRRKEGLGRIKKGLMNVLLTGKVRVKV